MKRKVSKLLTWLTALVLLVSTEALPVSAEEYMTEEETVMGSITVSAEDFLIEEETIMGGIEINVPVSENVETARNLIGTEFNVGLTGNEISLYSNGGIQTADEGQESILRYGSVSGYLTEAGDYELYSLTLSAGDYLQARLSVPNNTTMWYAMALYDSELNVIKVCQYMPYLNGGSTLEQSIGYLSESGQVAYIGVISLVGGSETEAFTLDFSIRTNYSSLSDSGEPNENVEEAAALNLGESGASVSGMLNSAIDNDWYSFTVIDSPRYDKIRLQLTSASAGNGCWMEIYQNKMGDYFAMERFGSGVGEGEVQLPAGTYYVRVVSTNAFSEFNPADNYAYNLSVVPVSRVEKIEITMYSGRNGVQNLGYPEGPSYGLYDGDSNYINIRGWAYYTDSMGNKYAAKNVKLSATVTNASWELKNRPDLATTYGTATTGNNGFFVMSVRVNRSVGLRSYHNDLYDYMKVIICPLYDSQMSFTDHFYLIHYPRAN